MDMKDIEHTDEGDGGIIAVASVEEYTVRIEEPGFVDVQQSSGETLSFENISLLERTAMGSVILSSRGIGPVVEFAAGMWMRWEIVE